jgi:serine/threonine protein kinase
MSFSPPTTIREIGNYEIIFKIAEGGMGAVYKGRHRDTGAIVAIKIIPPETARNQVLLKRFEQEFRAASLIDHPNVVKAIEYNGIGASPFLVMEYVDGLSLGEKVEREGPMRESFAISIIAQVCEGLHSAHKQGLIHRDVKPDNILVTRDGIAKLTDLGLVKDIDAEMNLTRTGKGLGTPHFMAPEQFRNAKNADVRCDVYSLAATLYMMVTGQIPFAKTSPLDCWLKKTKDDFPPPKALVPTLSERVDFAIRRSMKANPADRPANCREFMEDLTGTAWKPGQPMPPAAIVETPSVPMDMTALWHMVFYENGLPRTVKGTTETIRKNIVAGSLGDLSVVLVSRTKNGPFAPLRSVPEYRDLVLGDGSMSNIGMASTRLPIANLNALSAGSVDTPTSRNFMDTSPRLSSPDTPPRSSRPSGVLPPPSATPLLMGPDSQITTGNSYKGGSSKGISSFSGPGIPNAPAPGDLQALADQLPQLPNLPMPAVVPPKPRGGMPDWFPWLALILGAIGFAIGIVSLLK